jgi:hypothetical protein
MTASGIPARNDTLVHEFEERRIPMRRSLFGKALKIKTL